MVPDTIEQRVLVAPAHQHLALLLTLVQKQLADPDSKVMVFTPTSEQAIFLCGLFKVLTPSARVHELHGLLEPEARDGVRREFHSFTNQVLFATDVAARGMDFTGRVSCPPCGARARCRGGARRLPGDAPVRSSRTPGRLLGRWNNPYTPPPLSKLPPQSH